MNNLLTAIMSKCSGSALSTAVGGRIYEGEAPELAAYPNVVILIVTSRPEDTFTETIERTLIQFSLRSTSESLTQITGMYANLKTLFDDAVLTITSAVNVMTIRENLATMMEDITTPTGTVGCRHWAVDYSIVVHT